MNRCKFTGLLLLAIHGLLLSCSKDRNRNPAERTTVPLFLAYENDSHHSVTPHMTIYLDNTPVEVVFDTGSSGLRVLAGAVNSGNFETENVPVTFTYGDLINGTKVNGIVAGCNFSPVKDGFPTPIKFMLIDSLQLNGGAWEHTEKEAVTTNGSFRHLNAVMGVGMRAGNSNNGVVSPFAQLPGTGSFMITFPAFGGARGQVIINPDENDKKGFSPIQLIKGSNLLPNGLYSWQDNNLPGAVYVYKIKFQAPTLLDTGNPLVWVDSTFFSANHLYIPADSTVRLTVGEPAIADQTFVVKHQYSGLDFVEGNSLSKRNSFGIQFFFNNDVLIDQQNGTISIRKKQP